jgi:diguanylate cyclase (GGDEF)-like protein/PAS domain S-box-containing protein
MPQLSSAPYAMLAVLVLTVLAIYQQVHLYQIRRNARPQKELFQIMIDNAADMIALVDIKGRRLYNNPAYKRILGYSAEELSASSDFEQIHPDDRFKVLEAVREARETGVGQRLEYRFQHKDGSWRELESFAGTIRDSDGQVGKLVIVNRDITDRKRAQDQLEHTLFHDALTGLPNRRLFLDRLQQLFLRARRNPDQCYALLLANVDHFRGFNETLGPAGGDQILTEIAQRIGNCLRQDDTVARSGSGTSAEDPMLLRLGSDEFTVLLHGVRDPSDAMRLARRIQDAAAVPLFIESREVRPSMSIGIALSAATHELPENVLQDSDVAMRRAKALGGSRCELFDEAMHAHAAGRLRLEADLRTALAERQFRVFYQPIVELNSRRIVSFEALLRWQHPTQGLISPYRFIEAAEDTGLLVSVGRWLMLQACRQLREWEIAGAPGTPLNITVNVSERQFAEARLVSDVQDALRETGVDPSRLQMELTEGVAAADPKLTVAVFSHLKHMGIKMIMDDFGIGSSSLSGLRKFPVDGLKIDRLLIMEMQTDKTASDMVEVILTLARKMNLPAIAEGIETARQAERLAELGCEFGQGFYFSQPLEARAAWQFLREQMTPRSAGAAK